MSSYVSQLQLDSSQIRLFVSVVPTGLLLGPQDHEDSRLGQIAEYPGDIVPSEVDTELLETQRNVLKL